MTSRHTIALELVEGQSRRGLVAADKWAEDRLGELRPGRFYMVKLSGARNGKHHNKLFAILQTVIDATGCADSVEQLLEGVKLATGHTHLVPDFTTGEVRRFPKSISFAAMTQEEFDDFYNQALDALSAYTGIDRATLEGEAGVKGVAA